MKAQSNILSKIIKLLEKAGSTDSPAEAESLFAMAQKLMVKHRISQSDLNVTPQDEILESEVLCFVNKLEGNWELKLARVLSRPNCCDYIYSKFKSRFSKNVSAFNKICFFGADQDIQLVKFFFETTRETFRRIARSEYRRLIKQGEIIPNKNSFIRSFLIGACEGLGSKLQTVTAEQVKESGSTGYELIARTALEKVQQHIKTTQDIKSVKSRTSIGSSQGFAQGVETGKKHSLHIPVQTTSSTSSTKHIS